MATTFGTMNAQQGGNKTLIAWYSWGGNTEAAARHIQSLTGADIFIIEPVEAYSTDYSRCVEEAKAEINSGRTRAITNTVVKIEQYDTIIIGTPNWWSTMAPPVLEFLNRHSLAGKTVLPFVTHGGGREARCFTDMQKAAPGAKFQKGFVVSGNLAQGSLADIEKWLKDTGVI